MADRVLFIQSTRPGRKDLIFKILAYNKETGRGTLQGRLAPFESQLDKPTLLKWGYRVISAEKLAEDGISLERQEELCKGA